MNIPDILQKDTSLANDDYALLTELKLRAENGTHRERELYTCAKDFLRSIHPDVLDCKFIDSIYDYTHTNKTELFVLELLGKERLTHNSNNFLPCKDLFLVCISIRIKKMTKDLLVYLQKSNPKLFLKTDIWNNFILLCNRHNRKFNNTNTSFSLSSQPFIFVEDLLLLVDSSFSYLQNHWENESDSLNVDLEVSEDKFIKISSYCNKPHDYYLMVNFVERYKQILSTIYSKTENCENCYKLQYNVFPIDKTIRYNTEKYIIKPDLHITLNQINILKLLAGVNLYKDRYACLRELYQNSIDACRRRLCTKNNPIEKGTIIFGIQDVEGKGKYLYCYDNGVGMNEHVIENYLLRIGKSYYKSDEFLYERQNMREVFSPVSQFGIGIISCFMIGKSIDIITKSTLPGSNFIRFCIGDVIGNIYYNKEVSEEDKRRIHNGGTIVRVLLKDEYESVLHAKKFSNIGFMQKLMTFPYKYGNYKPYTQEELKEWENHIFTLLSSFICRPPENIDVFVESEVESKDTKFPRQPYSLKEGDLGITYTDIKVFESYYCRFGAKENIRNHCVTYCMQLIKVGGICFYPIVSLPINNIRREDSQSTYIFKNLHIFNTVGNKILAVDGIFVKNLDTNLSLFGMLDYTGDDIPKLSVDRRSVISYPEDNDVKLQIIEETFKKELSQLIKRHIKEYRLENNYETLNLIKMIGEEIGL